VPTRIAKAVAIAQDRMLSKPRRGWSKHYKRGLGEFRRTTANKRLNADDRAQEPPLPPIAKEYLMERRASDRDQHRAPERNSSDYNLKYIIFSILHKLVFYGLSFFIYFLLGWGEKEEGRGGGREEGGVGGKGREKRKSGEGGVGGEGGRGEVGGDRARGRKEGGKRKGGSENRRTVLV